MSTAISGRIGALAAMAGLLALTGIPAATAAGRASSDLSVSVGRTMSGRLLPAARVDLARAVPRSQPAPRRRLVIPPLSPYQGSAARLERSRAAAGDPSAPRAPAVKGGTTGKLAVMQNFDALNIGDDANANSIALGAGFIVEPPDQGLCVSPGGVLETVNDVVRAVSLTGDPMNVPVALSSLFGEPPQVFISDPRCYYDPLSKTFFATVLVIDNLLEPVSASSHLDIAVDTAGTPLGPWTVFQIDTTDATTPGCPCFGDQPLLGVDQHGVFVSTNEFAIAAVVNPVSDPTGFLGFHGAQVYAVDKAQLIAFATSTTLLAPGVNFVQYSGMMNGGVPAASMEPATTSSAASPAEYLLDSLDPTATTDNRLGVWAITNDAALDSGGTPTLSGVVISGQTYGQPPLAEEKQPPGSANLLDTDDDRMLQVQNVNGTLWGSLDTVVRPIGDTANRSGAAWFKVVPVLNTATPAAIASASIVAQGITAMKGVYLLYPALAVNDLGHPSMVMGESGAAIHPSVAVASGTSFTTLQTVYQSPTYDVGFSCSPCRWGDYSAAVWSSVPTAPGRAATIWLATEDLIAQGFSNGNWSTRILEVIPPGG